MASSLSGYPPSHGRTAAADDLVGCAGCNLGGLSGSVLEGARGFADARPTAGEPRGATSAGRPDRRRCDASSVPGSAGRRRHSPGRDSRRKRRSGRKSPLRTAARSQGVSVDSSSTRAASCVAVVLSVVFGILSFCLWRRSAPAESPELVDLAPGFGDDGLESPVKSANRAAPPRLLQLRRRGRAARSR